MVVEEQKIQALSQQVTQQWETLIRQEPLTETNSQPNLHYRTHRAEEGWGITLGLPHPYIIPAYHVFEAQFYWDTFFTVQGLLADGLENLAWGMVDNFCYLLERYGVIPNATATLWLGNVSQPPFFALLIPQVVPYGPSPDWADRAWALAKKEYEEVWLQEPHIATAGLARYGSDDGSPFWAEAESGWDFTPRFGDCRHCVPVDLNALLYRYETLFAEEAEKRNDRPEQAKWRERAEKRKAEINRLCWDEEGGLYMDYDFHEERRRPVKSLAAYYPLWLGMADKAQARALVQNLTLFETDWGLTVCDRAYEDLPGLVEFEGEVLPNGKKQWNYPNGWAPLHFVVTEALRQEGETARAEGIEEKFLALVLTAWEETGHIWENYNVVKGNTESVGRYPNAPGFSWTNAVFQVYARHYGQKFR